MPYRPRQKHLLRVALRAGTLLLGCRPEGGAPATLQTSSVILTSNVLFLFKDDDPRHWPQNRISLSPPARIEGVTLPSGEEAFQIITERAARHIFTHRDPIEFLAWKTAIAHEITKCAEPLRRAALRLSALTRIAHIFTNDTVRNNLESLLGQFCKAHPKFMVAIDCDMQTVCIEASGLPEGIVMSTIKDIGTVAACTYLLNDLASNFLPNNMGIVLFAAQQSHGLSAHCCLSSFEENPLMNATLHSLLPTACEHALNWVESAPTLADVTLLIGMCAALERENGFRWTVPVHTKQHEYFLNSVKLLGFTDCTFSDVLMTCLSHYQVLRGVDRVWLLYCLSQSKTCHTEVLKLTGALRTKGSYFASLPSALVEMLLQIVIAEQRLRVFEAYTEEDIVYLGGVRFSYCQEESLIANTGWSVEVCILAAG